MGVMLRTLEAVVDLQVRKAHLLTTGPSGHRLCLRQQFFLRQFLAAIFFERNLSLRYV
jgi:hypothetical protein